MDPCANVFMVKLIIDVWRDRDSVNLSKTKFSDQFVGDN